MTNHDGYTHTAPTVEHLLPLIHKRKPNLTIEQQTEVANTAISIFNSFIKERWMHPYLAVKMALVRLAF